MQLTIFFYFGHLLCIGWIASSEVFLGLAVISGFIAGWKKELQFTFHPLYFPLLAYAAASTVATIIHPSSWHRLELSEWFTFLVVPLAISLHRTTAVTIRVTIAALLILAVAQGLYGLYQYFFLDYSSLELARRITGTLSHVMTFSGIMLALSLLFIVLAAGTRQPAAMLAACASTVALVFTFTRGAWIGWIVGAGAILLMRRWRLVFYLAPLVILAITFSPIALFSRLVSSFDTTQSSNLDRIRMAEAGVEMIRDYPLFGVGPANVKEIYPLYRRADAPRFRIPHLHDNPIQIWAERGVMALVAYVLLLGVVLRECMLVRRTNRMARLFADACVGVTLGLAVAGLFEFNFGDTEVLLTLLNVIALCLAVIERSAPVEELGSEVNVSTRAAVGI
ncbi:MAG: O-antigen ligase family protein [Acidobacteriota bacterium]